MLERILSTALNLLFVFILRVVTNVFVGELVDNLHHVNNNVHILMAKKTDETLHCTCTDELRVCENGRLC